jgi:hypothetical protein
MFAHSYYKHKFDLHNTTKHNKQTNKLKNKQTNKQTQQCPQKPFLVQPDLTSRRWVSKLEKKEEERKKSLIICFCSQKWFKKKFKMEYERVPHKNFAKAVNIFFYHLTTIIYSGRLLMGSRIMGINRLMGSNWSHLTNPKLPFPTSVCKVHLLIGINRLLESVSLSPKVILLSGTHCNYNY